MDTGSIAPILPEFDSAFYSLGSIGNLNSSTDGYLAWHTIQFN